MKGLIKPENLKYSTIEERGRAVFKQVFEGQVLNVLPLLESVAANEKKITAEETVILGFVGRIQALVRLEYIEERKHRPHT